MTLLDRLGAFIDWLTPAHLKQDIHAHKRVRMFLFSHIFGPILSIWIPIALFFIDKAPYPHVPILAVSILAFWAFLVLLKFCPKCYAALAIISITNLNFAVLWGAYFYGGASSPFLIWYMLMPMLAFFYLGSKLAVRVAVLSQIVVGLGIFLAAYFSLGRSMPDHIDPEFLVYAGVASVFCATVYAFFMASYYSSVVDSQSELLKEIERHETTLQALTLAKEETDRVNDALERAKSLTEARNEELEAAKTRLEHNALHDALTGLPNRRYLASMLASHAEHCAGHGGSVALLHIDLDRFKHINDTLGHVAGDAMLMHVARLLETTIGADDVAVRVGGDEFIVVSRSDTEMTSLFTDLADRIIEAIRKPVPHDGHLCRLGASIGIAIETGREIDPVSLLVNSDLALYRAKKNSPGRFEFFSEEIQEEIVNTKRIADDILRGIEGDEFFAMYQPQFDARTHEIVGAEALVRWNHPERGILAPASFLKVAEDMGAVETIDRIILSRAIEDFGRWETMGFGIPKVSVNVSSRRLYNSGLIDSLREMEIKPGTITFELVESIFLDEADEVVATNIDQIKELGIEIEIDDFGTGYASIVSLLKLSPVRLKIDRQFVTPISSSIEKRRLVSSIIDMGKSLGIEVVAEGVETMKQAQLLREFGCDVLQGYAFGKPMAVADLETFVRNQAWRRAS